MVKKVVWTLGAHQERKDILDYWIFHNQSNSYSIKLNGQIERATEYLSRFPKTGRLTDTENVRTLRVHHYLLIYEETASELNILSLWGARQDPQKLKKRLE